MSDRLVLIHGSRLHGRIWSAYADRFPGWEVIAPDLPGHGSRVGEAFALDAALAAVDDALHGDAGGGGLRVLAGHSLGGYLAAIYAERHPAALDGLGLISATADPARHRLLRSLYLGFAAATPVVGFERVSGFMNKVLALGGVAEEDLPQAASYGSLQDAWRIIVEHCHHAQLAGLDCPVLILNGEFDQMRVDARRYARNTRLSRVATLRRGTHLAAMTRVDETAAQLADLLAKARQQRSAAD